MNDTRHTQEKTETAQLGFWLYIISDIMLFSAFFATYLILRNNTAGGPAAHELFDLPYVFLQTMLLLSSSLTVAFAALAVKYKKRKATIGYLFLTMLLGAGFLALELSEFVTLVGENASWQTSAFLSSFFGLVGLHGAHVAVGLIWCASLIVALLVKRTNASMLSKITLFGIFWHFIDIIWIAVITLVYLTGVGIHG